MRVIPAAEIKAGFTPQWWAQQMRIDRAARRISEALNNKDLGERFAALRALYREAHEEVMSGTYDPYMADWCRVFSPIEYEVWCSIRYYGLPMHPQYPVGRYFVDFGDPIKKIAVECDGKQWHNPAKDRARDDELADLGWDVYHIEGWRCMRAAGDPNGSDRIIANICRFSYPSLPCFEPSGEEQEDWDGCEEPRR